MVILTVYFPRLCDSTEITHISTNCKAMTIPYCTSIQLGGCETQV